MTNINLEEKLREHKKAMTVFVIVLLTALALVAGSAGTEVCDKDCDGGGGGRGEHITPRRQPS